MAKKKGSTKKSDTGKDESHDIQGNIQDAEHQAIGTDQTSKNRGALSERAEENMVIQEVKKDSELTKNKGGVSVENEATMEEAETKVSEEQNPGEQSQKIIRNHLIASMGMGLVPIPLLDMAGLSGIQLNMLRKLAGDYSVPFSKDKGKHFIAALLGSGIPSLGSASLVSFIKTVPIVGQAVGALAMPVIAGASTYAVGKVFVQHFASGGTFLNFNPEQVREFYTQMFAEGQSVVADIKK
ncbi:MAG: hypothetical protein DRI57_09035 [Deltaproteobacteria bacterium]|nr:MAG: hypothetical protein DRI57_09035 [Deltaproteobacteria bacterium]